MIIARYVFKKCLLYTLIMLFAFVTIFSVFNILGELGDVGKGNFNTVAMMFYIIALIPNFTYLLMPLAVLIGVMLGLLSMVNHSEYAVIRTSGVSLRQITKMLLFFGAVFSIITIFLGEVAAPKANQFAKIYKISQTKQIMTTQLQSGVWSKDKNNSFVNIKQIMPDNTILGISIFKYNDKLNLDYYITANEGQYDAHNNNWVLHDVVTYDYTQQNIQVSHTNQYLWYTSISPSYFNVLVVAPEDMSAINLLQYIHHLQANHQSTQRYQIALWNKLLYPLACISMALIALVFIPNNRRSVNLSSKLFFGVLIGVAFFFTTKVIGFMALLFNWNALLSAMGPTAILFACGWYFLLRKE